MTSRPLTQREKDVFAAMAPHLNGRTFDHMAAARRLGMTRPLFNMYLTLLTRADAIVRIAPGQYVRPEDPRATEPFEQKRGPAVELAPPKRILPKLGSGITLAMLTGGRAPRRRCP